MSDDSDINTKAAAARGWNTAHLVEHGAPEPANSGEIPQIRSLLQLREIFPQFFKSKATQ